MRITIFGNTNNYPLLLATGFRKLGFDVVLVVNRKERLHRPESRYPEFEKRYPDWIVDCSDIGEEHFVAATPRLASVINHLTSCSDGVLLNDVGPSLLEFCDVPAIALSTGSDLAFYGNFDTVDVLQRSWSEDYRRSPGARLFVRRWTEFIERQRAGICRARIVSTPFPGLVPETDALLREIGVANDRRDFVYLADTSVRPRTPNTSHRRLRVVNGARVNWKKPLPPGFTSQDHKGTDVLLHGFAEFIAAGGDAELVLFRKGLHVAETEALASSLGLASHIVWRGETSLDDFQAEIAAADVVCDQLGDSFPGMVALDAMALGIPVIANFRPECIDPHYPEPLPVFHATTPGEVSAHLCALAASPVVRTIAGAQAREFACRYLSPVANAARCAKHLGLA